MRAIDWFSGIGGFRLGLEPLGVEFVAHSEVDDYAEKVYRRHWPDCPNLGDIREVEPASIPAADMWVGGFPCQPFSVAGKREGEHDERDLWPLWSALVGAVRPRILFAENVPGLLSGDGGRWFGRCVAGPCA